MWISSTYTTAPAKDEYFLYRSSLAVNSVCAETCIKCTDMTTKSFHLPISAHVPQVKHPRPRPLCGILYFIQHLCRIQAKYGGHKALIDPKVLCNISSKKCY